MEVKSGVDVTVKPHFLDSVMGLALLREAGMGFEPGFLQSRSWDQNPGIKQHV